MELQPKMLNLKNKIMKKIPDSGRARLKIPSRKILLIMKLTFVLTCCLVFGLQAAVTAQKQVVSLNLENGFGG